ncbi:MAG: diacylglycerol kinase family lipid kinase [Anaerolineae bacterium]|nr:diacylglycerol kinase family lipid kinase [Anaerolineae bacterium]
MNQPAELSGYARIQPRRVHVIANPAAGQDRPFLNLFNRSFQEAGIDWELLITKKAGDAERFAREAVKAGADVVAAYGGDGTVGEVANGLYGTDVPLAIFPGGTANVMSVELGIPGDLAGAVPLACGSGLARPIDMGKIGDRKFLLRAAIGYTAEMTRGADREEKNRLGNLAYILSAIRELPNAQPVPYRLTLDGEMVEIEGAVCIVANSGSLGLPGWSLTRAVDVGDGLLDVIMIQNVDLNALLAVAASAIGVAEPLDHWQARDITIEANPPQTVECDGEIIEPTPFSASILPHAIRVLVPDPGAPAANDLSGEEANV